MKIFQNIFLSSLLVISSNTFCFRLLHRIKQVPTKYRNLQTDFKKYKQLQYELYTGLHTATPEEKLNNCVSLMQRNNYNIRTYPYSSYYFLTGKRGAKIKGLWYAWKETKQD